MVLGHRAAIGTTVPWEGLLGDARESSGFVRPANLCPPIRLPAEDSWLLMREAKINALDLTNTGSYRLRNSRSTLLGKALQ